MFDAEYRTGIPARIVDGGSIAGANHRDHPFHPSQNSVSGASFAG